MMEKQKYFIGCTLPVIGVHHAQTIAQYLANTFGIKNVFEGYPPHMTWKAPFWMDDNEHQQLVEYLKKFVNGRKAIPVTMTGFGHFGSGIVYCDMVCSTNALELVQQELCQGLESFPFVTFEKTEPSGIFHVTVGRDDIRARFPAIYENLKATFPQPIYLVIGSLDTFVKEDGKWVRVDSILLEQ